MIPTSNDTRSLNTQESFKVPKMLPPSGGESYLESEYLVEEVDDPAKVLAP